MRFSLTLALSLLGFWQLSAQSFVLNLPRTSQAAEVGQNIGVTSLHLSYHAPKLNDRELLGNLIPFNSEGSIPWRGGADENTIFSTSSDIFIGEKELPAGAYGIHFWVTKTDISAIFSSNSDSWGSFSYNSDLDVARVKVSRSVAPWKSEVLRYTFENIEPKSCDLVMHWGEEYWSIPIRVDVDKNVLAGIRQDLQSQAGWTWLGWYEAANYCLNNEVNLDEANAWIKRSLFTNCNPTNLTTHGRILQAQGKSNDEIVAALQNDLEQFSATWKEYNAAANFALVSLEDIEAAKNWADQSVEMNRTFNNSSTQARIMRKEGNESEAKKFEAKALESSTNAQANNYAYQLLLSGKIDEALEVFKFNAKRFPDDPNVHDSLGEAYVTKGDNKKAETSLKKSLSLNPPANVRQNSLRLLSQIGVDTANL